jgi:hypothetical protein
MFLKATSEYVAGEFPEGKLTNRSPEAPTKSLRVSMPHPAHRRRRQPIRTGNPRIELGRLCGHDEPAARRFPPPRERAKVQRPQFLAVKLSRSKG